MATSSAIVQPRMSDVQRIIEAALAEDLGTGDVTGNLLVPETATGRFAFVNREGMVACGLWVAAQIFKTLDATIQCDIKVADGEHVHPGTIIMIVEGNARALMAAERTALNLLQRLCSVATQTARFVQLVHGTNAIILDTRKTMPGLRVLDKYSVRAGGGFNHRMRLDDAILIKDNHIALCGSVREAVRRAKAGSALSIEIECDEPAQVEEAIQAGADRILLDNMDIETLKNIVAKFKNRVPLEASGNVHYANVRAVAETGVDYISIGRLTHSVPNIDIGLDKLFT